MKSTTRATPKRERCRIEEVMFESFKVRGLRREESERRKGEDREK